MTPQMDIARYIDQSLLGPTVTRESLIDWAERSVEFPFASLCVSPWLVGETARIAIPYLVPVCTVIGFPHGTSSRFAKADEATRALADGATELDMVVNVGALLGGQDAEVYDDIESVVRVVERESVPDSLVKVILSTAFLDDGAIVRACRLAVEAGADFVKTSTGFEPTGATIPQVALMRASVPESIGVKASGGIRTLQEARDFIEAGATRIGTSRGLEIVADAQL